MKKSVQKLIFFLNAIRLLPHLLVLLLNKSDPEVSNDLKRWKAINLPLSRASNHVDFMRLLISFPEYRNLFYYRVGSVGKLLALFCQPMANLYITTASIGPGLFIQHGFSTIIVAKSIGANCWINQQVTIGHSGSDGCPTLLDNVTVNAGAKIIGNITVGRNSIIGANSVVVKSVPADVTVVGVPGRIVRRNGIRVDEAL
jgi:serine O-acetyltransferase